MDDRKRIALYVGSLIVFILAISFGITETVTGEVVDTIWSILGSRYIGNFSGHLDVNETELNLTIDARSGSLTDLYVNETGDTMTGDLNISANLFVTDNLTAGFYRSNGTLGYELAQNNGNLLMTANVEDNNYFGISTTGAFLQLYSNPNPANGYLLFTITETQGADTFMNYYEGGTGHNRFWSSGSVRIGGDEGYLCSTLNDTLSCNTPVDGANLLIEGSVWTGRDIIINNSLDMTNGNITDTDFTCYNSDCSSYIDHNGTHLIIQT